MDKEKLAKTAQAMVVKGKGILAADESNTTCNKRFNVLGIPETEPKRREWREVLLGTTGIEQYLTGVILFDETMRQSLSDGTPFPTSLASRGILPGIKVDKGLTELGAHPGENTTEGLDGLRARFAEYKAMGAAFAKWRAAIVIDKAKGLPSDAGLRADADVSAMYALLAQEAGIVPMLEPEVLLDGPHTIADAEEVTTKAIKVLFESMVAYGVYLPGVILKTSMVVTGSTSGEVVSHEEVAERTARTLRSAVPDEVGGVVFLSGGQTADDATLNLNAIEKKGPFPWNLTFSFSRGIQQPVLDLWHGDVLKVQEARALFLQRLKVSSEASLGQYNPE